MAFVPRFNRPFGNPQNSGTTSKKIKHQRRNNLVLNRETDSTISHSCRKCHRYFDLYCRLPIILKCNHTVCEDCIQLCTDKVKCAECETIFPVKGKKAIELRSNYFLIGQLFSKPQNHIDMSHINFLPSGTSQSRISNVSQKPANLNVNMDRTINLLDRCSNASCSKEATVRCSDCVQIFCEECSEKVHKSTDKSIIRHKISSLSMSECSEHIGNVEEFHCLDCSNNFCSYCVIGNHNGHTLKQLTKLDEGDMPRFLQLLESCEEVSKKLQATHKKVNVLSRTSTPPNKPSEIEKQIGKYFVDLHVRLQMIESDLMKKVQAATNMQAEHLVEMDQELQQNIVAITELISLAKHVLDKNYNARQNVTCLLERMENATKIPCYIIESEISNSIEFVCGDLMNSLEENFKVTYDQSRNYNLVSHAELLEVSTATASSSQVEIIDTLSVKSSNSAITVNTSENISHSALPTTSPMLNFKPKLDNAFKTKRIDSWLSSNKTLLESLGNRDSFKQNDRVNVVITHINSPHSIFVHLAKNTKQIENFHKNLAKYVHNLELGCVSNPQINTIYIVKCVDHKSVKPLWCRGKLVDIKLVKNETMYEIYFIDYGNTKKVKLSDLRNISLEFSQIPPLAYECKIYGIYPIKSNWNVQVSTLIAEILTGCIILMLVFKKEAILEVDFIAYSDDECSIRDSLLFLGHAKLYDSVDPSINLQFKKQNKLSYYYKTDFKMLQNYQVRLSHVIDPHNMYVQLTIYLENLNDLEKKMFEYYNEQKKSYVYNPVVGNVIAVKTSSENNVKWCRALVSNVQQGKGIIDVFLVDYGETMSCNWHQIRKLQENFISLESQAIIIKLKDVVPNESKWETGSIEYFKKYLEMKENLLMKIYNVANSFEVLLFQPFPTILLCLNASLVQAGLAKSSGELSIAVQWFQDDPEATKSEETFTTNLLKTTQGEGSDEEDSWDEDDSSQYNLLPVEVLSVTNPDCIYVHFFAKADFMTKLNNLHLAIQQHYEINVLENKSYWKENEFGMAYDATKHQYYRILIKNIIGDVYIVFSRDYAFEFTVDMDNLGILPEEFFNYPPFAYRCHLYGVKPSGKEWSLTAKDYLTEILVGKKNIFFAKIGTLDKNLLSTPAIFWLKKHEPPLALKFSTFKMRNINKKLARNGLANLLNVWNDSSTEKFDEKSMKINCFDDIVKEEGTGGGIWLPPTEFKCLEFEAIATYVDENANIYYNELSDIPLLRKLEIDMQKEFEFSEPDLNVNWKVNDRCSVKYHQNKKWYRGLVVDINEEYIQVTMIDFGNVEDVKYDEIRRKILFDDVPMFAKRIKLDKLYPPLSGKFVTSDLDILHKLVVEKTIKIKMVETGIYPPTAEVYLDKIDVNAFMIKHCSLHEKIAQIENEDDDDDEDVIIENGNTQHLDYIQSDIQNSDLFEIIIINVFGGNKIFVVFETTDPKTDENIDEFKKLSDIIDKESPNQPLLKNPKVNQPCVAKYKEDNIWYRGRIMEVETNLISVYFVDYGNVEGIAPADIREIKHEWLQFPLTQYLANMSFHVKDGKTDNILIIHDYVSEYLNSVKRAKIVNKHPLTVKLYELDTEQLSYQYLIDSGVVYE